MSRTRCGSVPLGPSFPRVSGDEPLLQALDPDVLRFSPRERG